MSWITRRTPPPDPEQANPNLVAERFPWLVDRFLESYICWREACLDARAAYRDWKMCRPPQRVLAFAGYRAALDREEHAAGIYSDWTERLLALER